MSNRERAIEWMRDHHNFLKWFLEAAIDLASREHKFGINLLREHTRWFVKLRYRPEEPFKFCNTYSPYVARWILWKEPWIGDYMECKPAKDEDGEVVLITDKQVGWTD